jgi:ribosomal protein L40E
MKTAYWTQYTHLFRADEYICSRCGVSCGKPAKVCPKCGSKMKKGRYDASWVDEAEGVSAVLDEDW